MPWKNGPYTDEEDWYGSHESDRGANDEGYYYEYCIVCSRKTEHDPCSGCCEC